MKKKIAILGGGPGALTTAFFLSRTAELRDRYDITIFQMGWRLGGKCASSRNRDYYERSEEHGIHGILGCYENTFDMLREVFDTCGRPKTEPLSSCVDGENAALKPWFPEDQRSIHAEKGGAACHTNISLMDRSTEGDWALWPLTAQGCDRLPGASIRRGDYELDIWEAFDSMLRHMRFRLRELRQIGFTVGQEKRERDRPWFAKAVIHPGPTTPGKMLDEARRKMETKNKGNKNPGFWNTLFLLPTLVWIMDEIRTVVEAGIEESDPRKRQLALEIELWLTAIRGSLVDGLLFRGLPVVAHLEFSQWLRKHGASEKLIGSGLVESITSAPFGYSATTGARNLSTTSALRMIQRLFFDYRTSFFWEMQAGMGEAVIMPMYEALKKNGVHFEFFHRVEKITPGEKKEKTVKSVTFRRQVRLKNPDREYEPGFETERENLHCWPEVPKGEELAAGQNEILKRIKEEYELDLESPWFPNEELEEFQEVFDLEIGPGKAFDHVVLAIPIAAQKALCGELAEQNKKWKAMLEGMQTTMTKAFQIYTKRTVHEMGWRGSNPNMMLAFGQPFDIGADYSLVLKSEDFPEDWKVRNASYFVNTMIDPTEIPEPGTEAGLIFQKEQNERVKKDCDRFMKRLLPALWPDFQIEDLTGKSEKAEKRIQEQFHHANINPSDRYTLAPPGKKHLRMKPDQSQFANLTLAGDWTDNHIHIGSFEGTIMSGKMAARAVSGEELPVYGEKEVQARGWFVRGLFRVVYGFIRVIHTPNDCVRKLEPDFPPMLEDDESL